MNEETPSPFDTVGDAPVEARIVAWVLGEASAFEAAELARLCEESPELLLFHRRMLALHGLLAEAESTAADPAWKLSAEKRGALDEILGQEKVIPLDPQKELRVRRAGMRAFFAIAACLVLAVVVLQLIHPVWISRSVVMSPKKSVDFMPGASVGDDSVVARESTIPGLRSAEATGKDGRLEMALETKESRDATPAPASRPGTYKVDSAAAIASREPGLQQAARQNQLAKQEASRQKGVKGDVAGSALGEAGEVAIHESEPMPRVAFNGMASGLGGQGGIGNLPAPPATSAPEVTAAPPAPNSRAGGRASQGGFAMAVPKPTVERFKDTLSESLDDIRPESKPDVEKQLEGTGTLALNENQKSKDKTTGDAGIVDGDSKDIPLNVGDSSGSVFRGVVLDEKNNKPADGAETTVSGKIGAVAGDGASVNPGSYVGLAEREMVRRQAPVSEGDALLMEGKVASAKGQKDFPDEHAENVDEVGRSLYAAEGNFNLGKFDDSKKVYEEVLRTDPNNSAARRGLEKVASAKRDYKRAGYDHTRAEQLAEVDKNWELAVPADGKNQEFAGGVNYGSPIQEGSKKIPADAAKMKIAREMIYPTESEPAELPNSVTQPKAVFPATPDAPSSFDTRKAGAKIAVPAAPKPDLVELMEEIPAAETPYSTFSLNISDASFQMARASLAKGERPDPASIKPEQFYNAVDYGDPAPTANEPVAATIEQSAHPIIPGRNLVRVALRTGSVGRSAAQPLRLTLLVDQSGSMAREDRRAAMDHALAQLGGLLTKNDLVSVVGFSRTSRLLADGVAGDQCAKLGGLVNLEASEGGTNLEEALKVGRQMAERHQLAGAQNRIVLFTDGAANLGDADPARLAEQVKALRQKGIAFDIAGIGADGLNDRLLGEMARNGNGRYYVVGNDKNDSFARQLAGAFRPAAENVKVQVNFNPQRVGKYKLIGFEKDRLKTEDFRNDSVDAAELAAEEAGVAIYQVEPLAGGSGELGEVSVRFRDAAGGQMVERSWTIPHDARATAFDRATPSMQLAGLALFAAQKLQGGPLADAIDFKQLAGSTAFVKQFYGSSPRVSDMLQVIEKLK